MKKSNASYRILLLLIGILIGCIPGNSYPRKHQASKQLNKKNNTKKQKITHLSTVLEQFFKSYNAPRDIPHPSQLGRKDDTYKWLAPKGNKELDQQLLWTARNKTDNCCQTIADLLKRGANPNIIDPSNPKYPTPLHKVAEVPELVELLLQHGATFTPTNKDGETVLHTLFLKSDQTLWPQEMESAKLLLDYGDDVNSIVDNDSKDSLLHYAIFSDCPIEKIRFLLENNVNIEARSDDGETALHYAAYVSDTSLIKILFDNGADLTAHDDNRDKTPLGIASELYNTYKQTRFQSSARLLRYLESNRSLKEAVHHKTAT